MKILSKKKLALSVSAIVGAAGLVSSANAVHFPTDGLGDALMNYYTVNDGRQTLINYTNTSNQTIAMRVRLHEASNSRPVDFTVILSPYDVWNATIANGPADVGPIIFTSDESCTIPLIGTAQNPTPLKDAFKNAGVEGESINEGYVAAIVMGSKAGEPSCASETALFTNKSTGGYAALLSSYGAYTNNAIKGIYNILNVPLGQNAGAGMTTLADFFQSGAASAPYDDNTLPPYPNNIGSALPSLVTLQLDPGSIDKFITGAPTLSDPQKYLASFYLPTLASANTPAYVLLNDNSVGTTRDLPNSSRVGAAAVSYLFARTDVINSWTKVEDGYWDTATDLVVQSYVKHFFVDDSSPMIAGRYNKPGLPPQNILNNGITTAPFNNTSTAGYCDPVYAVVYDREENAEYPVVYPTFSPMPNPNDELCWETNVISFNEGYPLGSPHSYNIDTSFESGWVNLDLRSEANAYRSAPNPTGQYYGLPIDSFAFTTRIRTGGFNEGIIFPSAYLRNPHSGTIKAVAP